MKIGLFNVRGLGSKVKKDEVVAFFNKNELDICCVQETKLETFSEMEARRMWRTAEVRWGCEGSVGHSGGLLTFWDERKFVCSSHWSIGGTVVVVGKGRETGETCYVVNVYFDDEQLLLWDKLNLVVEQWAEIRVCLIGDFNSILEVGEMEGSGQLSRGSRGLKEFVENHNLVDVKIQGRGFTWFRCNGKCKSRMDRAFVNDLWLEKWQDTSLRGLPRSISDHCPIILSTRESDWGPRPFWFINAWTSHF